MSKPRRNGIAKTKLSSPASMLTPGQLQVLTSIRDGTDLAASFPISVDFLFRRDLIRRGQYGGLLITDKGKKVLDAIV